MMIQGGANQAPVRVSVIGRAATHEIAATTGGVETPNVVLRIVGPMLAVLIRFVHEFLTSFVGTLTAGVTVDGLIAGGNMQLVVKGALIIAATTAGIGALKNLITIFGNLGQKYPLISGEV